MDKAAIQSLYWLIMELSYQARQDLAGLTDGLNLTGIQAHVLCAMTPGRQWPISHISRLLVCDKSNVTGIVDSLLTQRLITRKEAPHDRRVKMLQLTKKGERGREKLLSKIMALEAANSSLDNQERQQLRQLLSKLLQG